MAVAPLFVADMTTLISKLRLTGAASADQVALIASGVRQARLKFNKFLGVARVAVVVAYSSTDNPTTNVELLRALAEETEVLIVRRALIETMPQLFMDASGATLEQFNSEAAFRQGRPPQRALDAWDDEVLKNLDILKGSVALGSSLGKLRTDTIDPDPVAPAPGSTVWRDADVGRIDRTEFPISDGAGDL